MPIKVVTIDGLRLSHMSALSAPTSAKLMSAKCLRFVIASQQFNFFPNLSADRTEIHGNGQFERKLFFVSHFTEGGLSGRRKEAEGGERKVMTETP